MAQSHISSDRAQEIKSYIQEMFFEVPATEVSAEDVREIGIAERRIASQSVRQRVKAIAATFQRSESTIRDWISQGLNVHDTLEVFRFVEWKNSRRRNRRDPDSRPKRIRSPFD